MPTEELHEALRSAFRTKRTISGVKDDGGAYYPLSLLSRAPSYFSKGTFFMVTVAGRASKAAAKKPAAAPAAPPAAPPAAARHLEPMEWSDGTLAAPAAPPAAPPAPPAAPPARPRLQRRGTVSAVFHLSEFDVKELFAIFQRAAPGGGALDRATFRACFSHFIGPIGPEKAERPCGTLCVEHT